jgi:hypothetical protein
VGETGLRIYRLTAAGTSALRSARSVPDWYRDILRLVQGGPTSSELIARMTRHPGKEVLQWIEQLETLGFVESLLMQRRSNLGAAREASA